MPFLVSFMRNAASLLASSLVLVPALAFGKPPSAGEIDRLAGWFAPPEFASPKLSPDGAYLAFIVRDGENYAIGIFEIATRQLTVAGGSGKLFPLAFWWKGPRRILTQVISTDGKSRTFTAFDIDGKNPDFYHHLAETPGRIVDALPNDPNHVLRSNGSEVFQFNIHSGKITTVAGHLGRIDHWSFDQTLTPRAAYRSVNDAHARSIGAHRTAPTGNHCASNPMTSASCPSE